MFGREPFDFKIYRELFDYYSIGGSSLKIPTLFYNKSAFNLGKDVLDSLYISGSMEKEILEECISLLLIGDFLLLKLIKDSMWSFYY